jgi:hypothetical protein
MPGFVLEKPLPLARFHNTVNCNDSKHIVVGLNSLKLILDAESIDREDVGLIAITVQGKCFKIYNVNIHIYQNLE